MFSNATDSSLTTAGPFTGLSDLEKKRLQYPRWAHTTAGLVLLIFGIFGTTENILVLYTFARSRHLRSATNIFIICLAMSDLSMALFGNPLAWYNGLHGRWVAGDFLCSWEGFVVYTLGLTSLYLLTAVSVDRFIVISKPLKAHIITKRVATLSCFGCFLGGLFWSIMPFFGWSSYGLEAPGVFCGLLYEEQSPSNTSYIVTIFFFCFFFPLGIMVFCYYNVFMTIKHINKNSAWDMKSRVARKNLKVEKKMFKSCIIMCGVYWLCWVPYALVSFWQAFGDADAVPLVLTAVPAVFAKSQIVWNPIIYVATNSQLREAFYANLPCKRIREALKKREEDGPNVEATKTETQIATISLPKDTNAVAPMPAYSSRTEMSEC